MRRAPFVISIAFALMATGCSSGSDATAVDPLVTAPTTSPTIAVETTDTETAGTDISDIEPASTRIQASTTPPTIPPTTPPAPGAAFSEISDVAYLTMNGVELLMDVYTPAGAGPWPIVVAFHGNSPDLKDDLSTTIIAEAAAAQGMLVFVPSWFAGDPFPLTIEDIEMLQTAGICAVAFAQQYAKDHGGDSTHTVVYGFSAGTAPALSVAVDSGTAPTPGCATGAMSRPVAGVVLGDGEYFFHSANFDGAFQADLEAMQAEVAALTDPNRWPADLDATFFIWVAADGTAPRPIDDPSGDAAWLAQRDVDGSIRADLDRLDQLDDGVISYIDSGRLLELRLSTAGLDVTLVEYPGGHTVRDKVPELVAALRSAARQL